jgi:hypothetical protein
MTIKPDSNIFKSSINLKDGKRGVIQLKTSAE